MTEPGNSISATPPRAAAKMFFFPMFFALYTSLILAAEILAVVPCDQRVVELSPIADKKLLPVKGVPQMHISIYRTLDGGFTLIELLIVVAIIAILVAIAVPNFLEAQTRSKVARTQADMRSMAVAVEAYFVDSNRYPLPVAIMSGSLNVVYPMPVPMHNAYDHNFLPHTITTPIAYLSTIFTDVFANPGLVPEREQSFIYYQSFEYTRVLADQAGAALNPAMQTRANAFGPWVMFANGPDRDRKDMAPTAPGVGAFGIINGVYDPTNGTVSNGDIIRTQRNPSGFTL